MTPERELQIRLSEMIYADAKAVRRGVSVVIVHESFWEEMGCPNGIFAVDRMVPVEATGTRPDWVRWLYRRTRRRARK